MNNLQRDFLKQSIESLENLDRRLRQETDAGAFSESFSRQSFRTLHTIKGTAQTFGFPISGKLAHELENLLSVAKNGQFAAVENCKALLLDGFDLLKKSFEQKITAIPADFNEKLRRLAPRENDLNATPTELPAEIFSQLSGREKNVADSAQASGKNLFCLEIGFDLAEFAEGITTFREVLIETCEIIATLPAPKFNTQGKIGFQILLATAENAENIKNTAEKYRAEIVYQKSTETFSNDLDGALKQVAAHGKNLAERLGKIVDFQISAQHEREISPQILKIVFDALLHLVRNAVDHAIENSAERISKNKLPRGLIKINFSNEDSNFRLTIFDDGRGIDAEKIRAKAIEKNIVSAADLTEQAALELIFAPEFSTAERLTEISGRGIGLDAVKNSIETAGGAITLKTRKGEGTIFTILLPENL